jgi:energy-converting hydrogenase Eha subunit C
MVYTASSFTLKLAENRYLDIAVIAVLKQNVFRLQITMNNSLGIQEAQRIQQLNGKSVYELHVETLKVV